MTNSYLAEPDDESGQPSLVGPWDPASSGRGSMTFDSSTPPPSRNPEFWTEQSLALAKDLNAIAAAFLDLSERLPRAIQQAADLGLMREQHDYGNLSTALQGDIALNVARDDAQRDDHASIAQLQGHVALLRADLERLAGELRQLRGEAS